MSEKRCHETRRSSEDAAALPLVLITNQVPDEILAPLDGLARVRRGTSGLIPMDRQAVLRLVPELSAIINQGELRVDAELLQRAPRLRIVANVAAGTNNMAPDLMAARGVWATNVPDAFSESTADCTLALLLGVARRLPQADRYVRSGQWPDDGFRPGVWDGTLLAGKTLGIVGYGRIGRAVARRARAFGMQVVYCRRQSDGSQDCLTLDALLRISDFVSLHVPLTAQTRHLLDAHRLGMMKKGAYLINMARGPVVDEGALVDVLCSGHLAGAGLDVFENEPVVHPGLLELDNVFLAPHMGGGTAESRRAARTLCVQNVAAVLRGEAPLTPINQPRNHQP